ncbi:MAG: PqqD family peptide modification chaperone [Dehalococcoidia bacterium]|nr:PqqD family peptide modification chaperone [Dehalococcoidia bacterium]
MIDLDSSFVVNERDVVAETIDGEALILNLKTGIYYSVDGAGAGIWEDVTRRLSARQIAARMSAEYAVETGVAQEAVLGFISELQAEELIIADGMTAVATAASAVAAAGSATFVKPSLHKYTDMQELLLLDPIHEVDETAGWPIAKPEV